MAIRVNDQHEEPMRFKKDQKLNSDPRFAHLPVKKRRANVPPGKARLRIGIY
jgi:hypothetical protein